MELDFSKMKFRIDTVPLDKEVLVYFPELKDIFLEFIDKLQAVDAPTDFLLRYIIYTYHQHSPFQKIEDFFVRKKTAMIHAGATPLPGGDLSETMNAIINNESVEVVDCAIQFMKFERNMKFMSLSVQREAWCNLHRDLLLGKNVEGRIAALTETISTLESEMFSGENELGNFVAANKVVANRIISPEQYVASRKSKVL